MSDTVEIPRAELDTLRRVHSLLDKMWTHPERAMEVKRLAREIEPSLKVPELDIVSQVDAAHQAKLKEIADKNSELTDRLDKLQKELTDERDEGKLRASFDKVKRDYSLTDQGFNEVIDLMKDRQLADAEAAAALWSRSQPPPARPVSAPTYLPQSMDLTKQLGPDEEVKEWLSDHAKKFDSVVSDIVNGAV